MWRNFSILFNVFLFILLVRTLVLNISNFFLLSNEYTKLTTFLIHLSLLCSLIGHRYKQQKKLTRNCKSKII